jgi:Integrase core domain
MTLRNRSTPQLAPRDKYYKEFALSGVPYSELKNEEHANLYVKPRKEKKSERPRVIVWIANAVQQADLLPMPTDPENERHILTVVDVATRTVDAEPLKSKQADAVLKAFKAIYKRGGLKPPSVRLEVDNGGEFKSVVWNYFVKKIGVHVKYGKPGRHKQQCYAECANGLIGKALHQRMSAQEMLTGEPSREWIDDLPIIVKALNRRWKRKPPPRPEGLPIFTEKSGELLLEGTRVRVALDEPRGVPGEKLPGKFRASDIRWDPKIHIIKKAILSPEQPPTYLVDGPHGS